MISIRNSIVSITLLLFLLSILLNGCVFKYLVLETYQHLTECAKSFYWLSVDVWYVLMLTLSLMTFCIGIQVQLVTHFVLPLTQVGEISSSPQTE